MTAADGVQEDATALAAAIRRGETTAVDVLEASLARIAERADLGAVARIEPELGRDAAALFDSFARRGSPRATRAPLGGVPFLMKDLGNGARGLPPVAGSRAVAARTAEGGEDSALARRFRRLGLVPFGLTTTPELGLALTSEPAGVLPARNPFEPSVSAGGSSGGAAAAVAAGLVAIAHATDAAGSIRVPAAACGLLGLKPTRGTTPNGPAFSNHLGGIVGELVVARSVRDIGAVLAVAAGQAEGPFADPDLDALEIGRPLRIAIATDRPDVAASAERRGAVEDAAAILEAAGHRIVPIDTGRLAALCERADAVVSTLLCVSLANWLAGLSIPDEEVSPLAAAARAEGASLPATALFAAEQDAVLIAHGLWRLFERVDAVLTPVFSDRTPRVGDFPLDHRNVAAHFALMGTTAPFATVANAGGIPALAVPLGIGEDGLPRSVQILGPMTADHLLLSLAETLVAARPTPLPGRIAGLHS